MNSVFIHIRICATSNLLPHSYLANQLYDIAYLMLQCMCKTRGRPDWLKTLNQFRILAFERYKAILRKLYSYFRKKLRSRPIRFTKSDYLMVDVVINVYQSWCCSSQFRKTQSYEGGLWEFSADAAVLCSAWSYAGDVSRTRAARVQNVHDQTTMYQHAWGLQGETTSTLVEREGAALLQQSFGLHSTIRTQPWQVLSRPIGWDQSVWCVASTFTFGLGCGHRVGIRSTVELCRFCVLSLHREVGGVRQYTW